METAAGSLLICFEQEYSNSSVAQTYLPDGSSKSWTAGDLALLAGHYGTLEEHETSDWLLQCAAYHGLKITFSFK